MTTIRVKLWKWTIKSKSTLLAEVLYVGNRFNTKLYLEDGKLYDSLPVLGGTMVQVSEFEANTLVEMLRRHYNVIIVRGTLLNPPKDIIISESDLLTRI
jgi:hypothetical protein